MGSWIAKLLQKSAELLQKLWLKQTEPTFTDLVQNKKRKKGCVLFN